MKYLVQTQFEKLWVMLLKVLGREKEGGAHSVQTQFEKL
jgi:hypothetical protein